MKLKRVVVVGLVLVGMLMVSSSEAIAASKIAFVCDSSTPGEAITQLCLVDPDGSVLTQISHLPDSGSNLYGGLGAPAWSPDGTQIAAIGLGGGDTTVKILNIDGSLSHEFIVPGLTNVAWSPELPPSVASLSPFNQTITVFLLGMIASALIMRGKAATEAS